MVKIFIVLSLYFFEKRKYEKTIGFAKSKKPFNLVKMTDFKPIIAIHMLNKHTVKKKCSSFVFESAHPLYPK